MLDSPSLDPEAYISKHDLWLISDLNLLTQICKETIDNNPRAVSVFLSLIDFLLILKLIRLYHVIIPL